ncbi:MAG: alpha/beta hydrolase [Candidatus Eremiobacteraeota bacterium]|nr:alpha/beta hydrolase [Candidatus Eremiobacteraeota bacterium]
MKPFSLVFALVLTLLATGTQSAGASPMQPTSSIDVGTTHVDVYGSGEPALILVPGLTDSAAIWSGTIAQFAPTHKIYALTLAGFGGSKAGASALIDTAVANIASLITEQHLNKPVVIGHSLGGHIVIRVAAEHSALIRGAIAVDGLPVFPGFDKMTADQRAATAQQITAPMGKQSADEMQQYEKTQFLPYMTKPKNVDVALAAGKGADPTATAEYMKELLSADVRPELSKDTVPLLELAPFDATLDPYNPQGPIKTSGEKVALYTSLFSTDKNAKVQLIDDSRHFIMLDQSQAFYDAVAAFLKTLG